MANPDSEVARELRLMTRVLAATAMQGTQRDKIKVLSAAHFSASEIAGVLGIPLNVVTSDLSKLKKATKASKTRGSAIGSA